MSVKKYCAFGCPVYTCVQYSELRPENKGCVHALCLFWWLQEDVECEMEIINLQCRQKNQQNQKQQRDKFRSCVSVCVHVCLWHKVQCQGIWAQSVCLHVISQQGYSDWRLRDTCMNAFVRTPRLRACVRACVLCTDACVSVREVTWSEQTKEREVELQLQLPLNKKNPLGAFLSCYFLTSFPRACVLFFVCVCVSFKKSIQKKKKRGKKRMREIKKAKRRETFTWKKVPKQKWHSQPQSIPVHRLRLTSFGNDYPSWFIIHADKAGIRNFCFTCFRESGFLSSTCHATLDESLKRIVASYMP